MNNKLEFFYDHSDKVCLSMEVDKTHTHPFELAVDDDKGGYEKMLITTAEARALLKFLKKHLEPKLENV